MRGTVLYGPGDIRFEDREDTEDHRTDGCGDPHGGHVRVRIGPLAVSGLAADQRPDADGARVLRLRRRGRQRGQVRQAGAVRSRLVRHVGQHLSALPIRLPVVVRASRVHDEGAGAVPARAAGGRDAGADAGRRSSDDLVPSLLATSDVLGTGWFAADAANVKPGVDRRGRRRRRGRACSACSRPSRWAPSGLSP